MDSLPNGLKIEKVHRYLENRAREFELLAKALEARDAEAIRMMSHRVKGNAALYGVPELGLVAGALVEAVDTNDWNEIALGVQALLIRLAEEQNRFAEK